MKIYIFMDVYKDIYMCICIYLYIYIKNRGAVSGKGITQTLDYFSSSETVFNQTKSSQNSLIFISEQCIKMYK